MNYKIKNISRRKFIRDGVALGALLPLINAESYAGTHVTEQAPLKVYIFSKHLQFLDYNDMAASAADMGFDGVDLTVRPKGHVLPENVEKDLPRAAEAIKRAGMSPFIMTTAIDNANDPKQKNLLQVASNLGFRNYRMNWLPYPENITMPQAIEQYVDRLRELGDLNRELNMTGFYQNHAGRLVGASIWELWQMLKETDEKHMGVQYDVRHGMVEGAQSWENGLRLIHKKIKALTIKDFKWTNTNGKWQVQDVPIGQGMVDFKHYFGLLKKYGVHVPISLHIEYTLGGVEHGASKINIDKREVFKSMKQDLQKVKELWLSS